MDWDMDNPDAFNHQHQFQHQQYQQQQIASQDQQQQSPQSPLQQQDQQQHSSQRRKLTKRPPSQQSQQQQQQYTHSYSVTSDGRFDAQSLQSKRSSSSLKRAPSAPHQNTAGGRSSNASNNSPPRYPPPPPPIHPHLPLPPTPPIFSSNSNNNNNNNHNPNPNPNHNYNHNSNNIRISIDGHTNADSFFAHTSPAPQAGESSPPANLALSYQVAAPASALASSTNTRSSPPTSAPTTFPATSASAGGATAASGAGVGVGIGIGVGTAPSMSSRHNLNHNQNTNNYTTYQQPHHQQQQQQQLQQEQQQSTHNQQQQQQRLSGSLQLPLRPLRSQASEDFVGAPFDGDTILSQFDKAAARPTVPHQAASTPHTARPQPPPPSADLRIMSPSLRRSASFSVANAAMSEKSQATRINDAPVASKRYSDESKESKPGVLRKKSGFSGLMSTLVGSPKKPVISAPENPVHLTHVGYDSSTGQFTVRSSLGISLYCLLHRGVT